MSTHFIDAVRLVAKQFKDVPPPLEIFADFRAMVLEKDFKNPAIYVEAQYLLNWLVARVVNSADENDLIGANSELEAELWATYVTLSGDQPDVKGWVPDFLVKALINLLLTRVEDWAKQNLEGQMLDAVLVAIKLIRDLLR